MGTVVQAGSGRGVVVATGARAEFGRIALGLGERQPQTEFQNGLRRFSILLVQVAAVLTVSIFVINLVLHRPIIDSMLFSLAIAVGISPQLLPAVVSTSLAAGSRQLAKRRVLVKRLVCIEDLGNIDVLFTDKTGTLTEGRIKYMRALGPDGAAAAQPLLFGLLCNDAAVDGGKTAGGNPLDVALWESPAAVPLLPDLGRFGKVATLPFDHDRRLDSVLVDDGSGSRTLIVKGAPEAVVERCLEVSPAAQQALAAEFAAGNRVVAVASRPARELATISAADECQLQFCGLLVFLDAPKPSAREALARLARLGVDVKVVTGDNPLVATTAAGSPGTLGYRLHPQVHAVLRATELRLRLRNVRRDAVGFWCARIVVPLRLVRRVAGDADSRHIRDPYAPGAILPKSAKRAFVAGCTRRGRRRRSVACYPPRTRSRLFAVATRVSSSRSSP
jgi:Mg2+-importing ATPase